MSGDDLTEAEKRDNAQRGYYEAVEACRRKLMAIETQCVHFRSAVSFETCKAGVRYAELAGTQRNRIGEEDLVPGKLPCWFGATGGREECPCYESMGAEAAELLR